MFDTQVIAAAVEVGQDQVAIIDLSRSAGDDEGPGPGLWEGPPPFQHNTLLIVVMMLQVMLQVVQVWHP